MAGEQPAPLQQLSALTRRWSPDTWAVILIVVAVVLANLPYLLDFFDPNPLGVRSGLATSTLPGLLPGQPLVDPSDGIFNQPLGHRAVLDWLHLRMPWWNPYAATGTPLAGEFDSSALFPPTFFTLFPNGVIYERIVLEIVAGLATYFLLRRLSLGRWTSVAGGVAFGLNGTLAWFGHAVAYPVPFLPLLLLGLEHAYAASLGRRRGGWWLIGVAGALSLYAGFPEVAFVNTLLAVGWFVWRCGCLGRAMRPFLVKVATGTLIAVLLCAPLLLAALEYFSHADLGAHAGPSFNSVHQITDAMPQLVFPYVYGPLFGFLDHANFYVWAMGGGYISTLLLLFASVGLFSRGRRGLRLVLLGWIVLALARVYGQPKVLSDLVGMVPEISRVFFSRYAWASIELPVIILAALGLDALRGRRGTSPRQKLGVAAAVALAAVAALVARPLADQLGKAGADTPYYVASVGWGLGILVVAIVTTLVARDRLRVTLLVLLVVADSIVQFAVPQFSAPRELKVDLAPVRYLKPRIGTGRFFTLGPLQQNYAAYFGIPSVNVVDVVVPKSVSRYVRTRLNGLTDVRNFTGMFNGQFANVSISPEQEMLRNLDGYRNAGVTFVLTPPGLVLPRDRNTFSLVFRSSSAWIYRLSGARPYFESSGSSCVIRARTRENVDVNCPGPSVLVRRETYLPGWSAQVDGRDVQVRAQGDVFQSIAVKQGSHHVTFSYAPPHIGWAYAAFFGACAWMVLSGVSTRRRRSGRTRSEGPADASSPS